MAAVALFLVGFWISKFRQTLRSLAVQYIPKKVVCDNFNVFPIDLKTLNLGVVGKVENVLELDPIKTNVNIC